ncbi:hypothetical protein M2451_002759 [Dysgonomonas sp. PFB1-18]|uniref:hypothetical protein n=1 Tax=unclassified Dysgonomonas TaxID=2630389 RepID=UPI002476214A|nr:MULTISPECIES: hypothetical protein [unclassified Dysgonomonas]MDH6309355.1 hypothetical protein [Dysgonomonas sp. PF1-14]MDH6339780.1 hypothetical protein [Dysgonomonas sp. PF1-16]MDH6381428.1 hypothetical protein [Dysgonomonas sp. PFB1-18]MDH6398643.1 hypothetical protein [Dysgonomonas sp. PF1-23]
MSNNCISISKITTCIIFIILILICDNVKSQIYYRKGGNINIAFNILYVNGNDTTRSELFLNSSGKQWNIYTGNSKQKTIINDSWAIEWKRGEYKNNNLVTQETGVKENSEKIFLHPPRFQEYTILEFCPFPLVEFPLKIGIEWSWELEGIGQNTNNHYYKAIKRKQKYPTTVKNHYRVTRIVNYYLPQEQKNIECFEIEAIGITKYGKTYLKTFFSHFYGFVYLEFKTLNNETFTFSLKEYNSTHVFEIQNKNK